MVDEAQNNLLKLSYNVLLLDAFAYWATHRDKSFMVCFDHALKEHEVQVQKNGVDFDMPKRDLLKIAVNELKSTAAIQMMCYVYELLYKNYDPSLKYDKKEFDKLKASVFEGPNNFNNEQLLTFIRNSVSHNDDMKEPSYDYSILNEVFTFLPTQKKKNSDSLKVTISEKELVDLIVVYMKNMNEYKQLDYILDIDMDKIKSSKKIENTEDFIKLRNVKTGEILPPDGNQKKVIKELIEGIRVGYIKGTDNFNFFYPYKQNVLNNFLRTSDFYHMLNCLYILRGETFNSYLEKTSRYTPSGLKEIKNVGDIASLFLSNRFFQVFSTTPNKVFQENITKTSEEIKLSKLRNAIMHGTYYKDLDAGIYIYDAPRPDKTEEKLEFIDSFTAEELEMLSMIFYYTKHSNSTR